MLVKTKNNEFFFKSKESDIDYQSKPLNSQFGEEYFIAFINSLEKNFCGLITIHQKSSGKKIMPFPLTSVDKTVFRYKYALNSIKLLYFDHKYREAIIYNCSFIQIGINFIVLKKIIPINHLIWSWDQKEKFDYSDHCEIRTLLLCSKRLKHGFPKLVAIECIKHLLA